MANTERITRDFIIVTFYKWDCIAIIEERGHRHGTFIWGYDAPGFIAHIEDFFERESPLTSFAQVARDVRTTHELNKFRARFLVYMRVHHRSVRRVYARGVHAMHSHHVAVFRAIERTALSPRAQFAPLRA